VIECTVCIYRLHAAYDILFCCGNYIYNWIYNERICPTRRKRNENEPDLEQNLDMDVLSIYIYIRLPSKSFSKKILLLKIGEIYMFIQFVDPYKLLAPTCGMYRRVQ
jgi:hypothetical protein